MTDYAEVDEQIEADLRQRLHAVSCTFCGAEKGKPCTRTSRRIPYGI